MCLIKIQEKSAEQYGLPDENRLSMETKKPCTHRQRYQFDRQIEQKHLDTLEQQADRTIILTEYKQGFCV